MLQFIASSVMKCSELEGILDTSAGEYLKRLESEYGLVRMKLP